MEDDEHQITSDWISSTNISNVEEGGQFIYISVLSETAKRLAGLHGIGNGDDKLFYNLLWNGVPGVSSVATHPLIRGLNNPAWSSDSVSRMAIAQRCYEDFQSYQKPGAERLQVTYSLPCNST